MRRRLAVGLLVALLVAASGACRDATEITLDLRLDDDVVCPANGATTTLSIGPRFDALDAPASEIDTCPKAGRDLGTLVLVPSSADAEVAIEVIAGLKARACKRGDVSCVVARRRIRFLKHENLRLPITLSAACVGVVCGADETCASGVCTGAEVDPASCANGNCGARDAGADVSVEAGSRDSAADVTNVDGATCSMPVGGLPRSPGFVDCPGGACDLSKGLVCCADHCTPAGQCTGDQQACDEPDDCGGQACCAAAGNPSVVTFCGGATCLQTHFPEACKTDCDCGPGGSCQVAGACPPLETCGGGCP